MACLYVIRHAEPDRSNAAISYHSFPGPGLTQQGHVQSQRLAAFLATYDAIGHIYISPFVRTRQTVAPLAESLGLEPVISDRLLEAPSNQPPPEMYEHLQQFLDEIALLDAPVAAVTHGNPVRILLLLASGGKLDFMTEGWDDYDNPTPVAGIWKLYKEADAAEWQCELVYRPDTAV